MRNPQGVVLYRGPSKFGRLPIVVVATGLVRPSQNAKTGPMVQVFIIPDNGVPPIGNLSEGGDGSVCGIGQHACPLSSIANGGDGSCYVDVSKSVHAVWLAACRGSYPDYNPGLHRHLFAGRMVRWGAYGEPVCIPVAILRDISRVAAGWTGYTHQWRQPQFRRYAPYLMASCHTVAHEELAVSMGWRFFSTAVDSTGVQCPAAEEIPADKRKTCESCGACNGHSGKPESQRVSIKLMPHGKISKAKKAGLLPLGANA